MSKRLEKIKAYKNHIDMLEKERIDAVKIKYDLLIDKVRALKPRISELIETANECLEYGIEINKYAINRNCYSYVQGTFVSNGMYHRVGFILNSGHISYVGIINGGACGIYDFVTDGEKIAYVRQNSNDTRVPGIEDLEKFVNGFDEFEKQFYSYIDSLGGAFDDVLI